MPPTHMVASQEAMVATDAGRAEFVVLRVLIDSYVLCFACSCLPACFVTGL